MLLQPLCVLAAQGQGVAAPWGWRRRSELATEFRPSLGKPYVLRPRLGDLKGHDRKARYSSFHVFAFIDVSPPLEAEAKSLHTLQRLLKRDFCVT